MPDITKFSLNAGELTDELAGRVDLNKVQMGLSVAENVRVLRVGGITRRAGFGYIAPVQDEDRKSRLEGFRFAENQGVCLEFGHNTMRVFKDGALVMETADPLTTFELATPWTESQVFALQFAQRVDGIVVTHPQVATQLLTRLADGDWTIQELPWQERVWVLATDAVVSLQAAAVTGSTTVTASAAIFAADWVGTRLRLAHVRPELPIKKTLGNVTAGAATANLVAANYTVGDKVSLASPPYTRATGKYAGIVPVGTVSYWTCIANYDFATDYNISDDSPDDYPAFFEQGVVAVDPQEVTGNWSFETFGTWVATYVVERRYSSGTWNPVKLAVSNSDKNFLVQDTEEPDAEAEFRVLLLDTSPGSAAQRFEFTVSAAKTYGYGVITAFNSTTSVDVDVDEDFESTNATSEWYEDAFNPRNGYPKACTFHQSRLYLGGSLARPQTIFASRSRRPFDFTLGTLAEDGLSFETEAREYESVLWLNSHLTLVVGTTSGVWAISSPNGLSITAENNAINKQVRIGSFEGIPAVSLQNNVLFLQTKGRKIHELTGGSVEYGGYSDVDLTQLASHITRPGVTQIAAGEVPDSSLYVVTGNQLALLTYERSQNVVGWSRWLTAGDFESVGICPGGGEDDDVYVVVKRGERRFVERLTPDMLRIEEARDMGNLNFLDSSIRKTEVTPFTVMDGLDHLEGLTVGAFADGEKQGNFVVDGGEITVPHAVSDMVAGLNYDSIATTMPLDTGGIASKTTIPKILVRVRNSLNLQAKQGDGDFSKFDIPKPRIVDNTPLPLLSGDGEVTLHSSWERNPTITLKQSDPLPMTILAVRIISKKSS